MDFRRDVARTADVLARLAPDVVGLQEVLRVRSMDQAATFADRLGMKLVWAEARTTRDGSYGNALLIRGDVVSFQVRDLTVGRRERRCCLDALVEVQGTRFACARLSPRARPRRAQTTDRALDPHPSGAAVREPSRPDGRLHRVARGARAACPGRRVPLGSRPAALASVGVAHVRARSPGVGRRARRNTRGAHGGQCIGSPPTARDPLTQEPRDGLRAARRLAVVPASPARWGDDADNPL